MIATRIARCLVGKSGEAGLAWGSTGTSKSRPLYWEAQIERTTGRAPSTTEVKLWNLSRDSIAHIERKDSVVQVLGGETTPGLLAIADISRVVTEMDQPDTVTTITAAEGQRIYRTGRFSRSYPAGTTRSQILTDLISDAGLTRGHIDPSLPERTYQEAVAFHGAARDALDQLFLFELGHWWLDGTTLHIIAEDSALPGNAPLLSPRSGLHGSPARKEKGSVDAVATLLPAMRPGSPFVLDSRYVKGNFRAVKVTHRINSWGTTWETALEGAPW